MSDKPKLPPLPPLPSLPALTGIAMGGLPVGCVTLPPLAPLVAPIVLPAGAPGREFNREEMIPGLSPIYQATPCRVLVADPPWTFADKLPGNGRGAEKHYDVLSLAQIKAFPLPPIADNAILFLWRVAAGKEGDDRTLAEEAYAVARTWGFWPKSEMVWRKTRPCRDCGGRGWRPVEPNAGPLANIKAWCEVCHGRGHHTLVGMGRYVRNAHEVCIIATRGKNNFPEDKSIPSDFHAHRGEHSEKPAKFYEIVERLYPGGPYAELFARRRREGWMCYGNELPEVAR